MGSSWWWLWLDWDTFATLMWITSFWIFDLFFYFSFVSILEIYRLSFPLLSLFWRIGLWQLSIRYSSADLHSGGSIHISCIYRCIIVTLDHFDMTYHDPILIKLMMVKFKFKLLFDVGLNSDAVLTETRHGEGLAFLWQLNICPHQYDLGMKLVFWWLAVGSRHFILVWWTKCSYDLVWSFCWKHIFTFISAIMLPELMV